MKKLLLAVLVLLSVGASEARQRPNIDIVVTMDDASHRINNLEQRVYSLENTVMNLSDRLARLENGAYPPPPPVQSTYSCMLVDSGYAKTFLGEGRNRLEAEAEARASCGKGVNSTYCNGGVRCSDPAAAPGAQGYICMVTDSGYGKSFRGEGDNAIQAEARAKQACQASVNATYCGNVTARCEAY